jgi:hypothetical protein
MLFWMWKVSVAKLNWEGQLWAATMVTTDLLFYMQITVEN